MRFVPLFLLLLLIGCGKTPSSNPASDMREQLQQWVPPGTTVAAARQVMEQHHFVCTVASYNRKAAMPPGSDTAWWDVGRYTSHGQALIVTNVTVLTCTQTNQGVRYDAIFSAVDGEITTRYSVSSLRLLN